MSRRLSEEESDAATLEAMDRVSRRARRSQKRAAMIAAASDAESKRKGKKPSGVVPNGRLRRGL